MTILTTLKGSVIPPIENIHLIVFGIEFWGFLRMFLLLWLPMVFVVRMTLCGWKKGITTLSLLNYP